MLDYTAASNLQFQMRQGLAVVGINIVAFWVVILRNLVQSANVSKPTAIIRYLSTTMHRLVTENHLNNDAMHTDMN